MSYASNLLEEGIDGGYLLVIAPRRYVTGWSSQGSDRYRAAFTLGQVVGVTSDDDTLTEVSSVAALTAGTFYFDVDQSYLWVHLGGTDPATVDMVASYELYLGTFDAHFNRDPLDDTTRTVYYEPLITKSPAIVQDATDSLFGYMPASSSQISIGNVTAYLNEHLSDGSFNSADLNLYHYLGELATENVKLVYRGLINGVEYTDDEVTFRVLDRINIFEREYRHVSDRNFFDPTTFPDIDPQQSNRPIRKVFGVVDGVVGVNYEFDRTPSASANRYWAMHSGTSDPGTVTRNVIGGSTNTRTYLDSANGIRVGDEVFIDSISGPSSDRHTEVLTVSKSPHYVEHADLGTSAASGSTLTRAFIGNAWVIHDGEVTRLPGDAWEALIDSGAGILSVLLDQSVASGYIGRLVGSDDQLYARVYGELNTSTLGASGFGSNSLETGTRAQGAVLLWDIMRGPLGLAEAELDTASFQALQANADDELGYQLPFRLGENFPLLRDVVTAIGQTMLLKVFLDDDGTWSVAQTGPLASITKTIDDDELLTKRMQYGFDYADTYSDIFVDYAPSEVTSRGQIGSELSYASAHSVSQVAKRLHRIVKQRTFQSLHFLATQAERLADRLRFYFGERRGKLVIASKQRFFDSNIDDVIRVSRTRMPGYALDDDTERQRNFSLVGLSKTLTDIELTLDDQKGIEDNAGDW